MATEKEIEGVAILLACREGLDWEDMPEDPYAERRGRPLWRDRAQCAIQSIDILRGKEPS